MAIGPESVEVPATRSRSFIALVAVAAGTGAIFFGLVVWLMVKGPVPAPITLPEASASIALQADTPPAPPAQAPQIATGMAAPDADLTENSQNGPLPIVAKDGRLPLKYYARPFDKKETRPRIAIVIGNLGTSATETDTAIRSLPGAVTLAFMPYRKRLGEWIGLARAAGHEVLLDLPMEPPDVLHNDPGPNALRTALDPTTNISRLEWIMAQATGYVGMVGFMGGRFEADRPDFQPILEDIRKRGLLFVDNHSTPQTVGPNIAVELKLPYAIANRQIDLDPSREAIDLQLAELEDVAKRNGSAVGVADVSVPILERVAVWAEKLEMHGLVLAPITAVVTVTPPPIEPPLVVVAPKPPPPVATDKPDKKE
jgi:polysaccharide deacetylase 2 family uncharacterized protein YibQ